VKTDQHSQTADLSAAACAAHLRYDHPLVFEDPLAIHLSSRRWRWVIKNPVLYRAIRGGIGQYVILGAGLDSFVSRRPEFADCLQVYEIDHPASQRTKRD
jgi:O-methyltransferase involved in polyketide biosynthesis